MRPIELTLFVLILAFPHPNGVDGWLLPHQQTNTRAEVNIETPVTGQAVKGSVLIRGSASLEGF